MGQILAAAVGCDRRGTRCPLAGDRLIAAADLTATAPSPFTPADRVWPWIAQLGQGRDGFYTCNWLENVAGLGMRCCPLRRDLSAADRAHITARYSLGDTAVEVSCNIASDGHIRSLVLDLWG